MAGLMIGWCGWEDGEVRDACLGSPGWDQTAVFCGCLREGRDRCVVFCEGDAMVGGRCWGWDSLV